MARSRIKPEKQRQIDLIRSASQRLVFAYNRRSQQALDDYFSQNALARRTELDLQTIARKLNYYASLNKPIITKKEFLEAPQVQLVFIDEVQKTVEASNPTYPLRLTITSATVAGFTEVFDVPSLKALRKIQSQISEDITEVSDPSENEEARLAIVNNKRAFDQVYLLIEPIRAGSSTHAHTIIQHNRSISFKAYSPASSNEECGIYALAHGINPTNPTPIIEALRSFIYSRMPKNKPISPKMLHIAYDSLRAKKKLIIEDVKLLNHIPRNTIVIVYTRTHYYIVESILKSNEVEEEDVKDAMCIHKWYFDFETRPLHTILPDGSSLLVQMPIIICGYNSTTQESVTFTSTPQISCARMYLDFLKSQPRSFQYSHNGSSFDHFPLLAEMTPEELKHSKFLLVHGRVYTFKYNNHAFFDTYKHLTASLSTLAESCKLPPPKANVTLYGQTLNTKQLWGYKKHLSPKEFLQLEEEEPEFWQLYQNYCMNDCITLSKVHKAYCDSVNALLREAPEFENAKIQMPSIHSTVTSGSFSAKLFDYLTQNNYHMNQFRFGLRELCGFKASISPIDKEAYKSTEKWLRNFVRGGISYVKGIVTTKRLEKYDMVSQYPYSAVTGFIPTGRPHYYSTVSATTDPIQPPITHLYEVIPQILYLSNNRFKPGYYEFSSLHFASSTPTMRPFALSTSYESLQWITPQHITGQPIYLSSELLNHLLDEHGLFLPTPIKALVFPKQVEVEKLTGAYFNFIYKLKQKQDEYKLNKDSNYNPSLRDASKLLLNALTGKFIECKLDRVSYNSSSRATEGRLETETIGHMPFSASFRSTANEYLRIGLHIYDHSKISMFKYFRGCRIYQFETDGVIVDAEDKPLIDANITRYSMPGYKSPVPILGEIEHEASIRGNSYFLAKKISYYETIDGKSSYNLKGIPSKTLDDSHNDVTLISKRDFEVLANGDAVEYTFGSMNRSSELLEISNTTITRRVTVSIPDFEGMPMICPTQQGAVHSHKSYLRRDE